jgi:hypothetical protein
MTSFPRSPRLRKGAIVSLDMPSLSPQVIIFQYNPDTLSRTLKPKSNPGKSGSSETFRLEGPPEEQIDVEIELDATDQLENPDQNPTAVANGVSPQLAALEMILYPKASRIIANAALALVGTIEMVPPEGPFTLFIWGPKRVLPVRLIQFRISEEAYDVDLNPIRAKVNLSMKVLSYGDLQQSHIGYALYLANHVGKELLSAVGSVNNMGSIGSAL